jgi:hypothetical protein
MYAATGNRTRLYNKVLTVNNDADYSERKAIEWRNRNYDYQTYKHYSFLGNIFYSFTRRCVRLLPLYVIYRFLRSSNPKMRTACSPKHF